MAQMKREQKQAEDVKAGYIIILKCVDHHGVNVVVAERISLKQAKPLIQSGPINICKFPSKCPITNRIRMMPVTATIIFFPIDER